MFLLLTVQGRATLPAVIMVFVILLLFSLVVSSHHVYYVLPYSQSNSSCPTSNCHTLAHYAAQIQLYFKSNTIFYFMAGQHYLDRDIEIQLADNLILEGLGDGREENSKVPVAIITCTEREGGFSVLQSQKVTVNGIAITNCKSGQGTALTFGIIQTLKIIHTSVYDNEGIGLKMLNVYNLVINKCNFSRNARGSLVIYTMRITTFNGSITNSNFTFGDQLVTMGFILSSNVTLHIEDVTLAHGSQDGNLFLEIENSTITGINLNRIDIINGRAPYTSIGGGLTLSLRNIYCSTGGSLMLRKIYLYNNFGKGSSGMSILLLNVHQCNVTVESSLFFSNGLTIKDGHIPSAGGGGVGIMSINGSRNNLITISNCEFQNNRAMVGGAMVYWYECMNQLKIVNTKFEGNSGFLSPAFSFRSRLTTEQCKLILENVTISNNRRLSKEVIERKYSYYYSSRSSAITVYMSNRVTVEMTNVIIKNHHEISGMSLHGCDVAFNGKHNAFINNTSPSIGGALIIPTANNIIVNEGSHILFANNSAGIYGGAIYIKETDLDNKQEILISFVIFGYMRKCSFITNHTTDSIKPLVTFENNHALKAGDDVYGGVYQVCDFSSSGDEPSAYYDPFACPVTRYWSLSNEHSISSSPIAVCPCFNNEINCTVRHLDIEIYPGQPFSVSLVTLGTCQGVSPGDVVASTKEGNIITIAKNQVSLLKCKEFKYTVRPSVSNTKSSQVIVNVANTMDTEGEGVSINITYLPCPHGFQILNLSNYECGCNSVIRNSIIPTQCNLQYLQYGSFNRSGNNWIGYLPQYNCTIAHVDCPFDYCKSYHVSFNITSPDPQCDHNRSGVLCGQCSQGLSLMLARF